MGIKNNKKFETSYSAPYHYATVVLAYFLALRQAELEIIALYDTSQGSAIEAKLSTDIFSLGGSLAFEFVDESSSMIRVQGSTEIKGQMFDWGKGKRTLLKICESAEQYMHKMTP